MANFDFQPEDFKPDFQPDFQEDEKKGAAKAPNRKSTWTEDVTAAFGQVGNTVDRAWTGAALAAKNLFTGPDEAGDKMYQNLQERIKQRTEMTGIPENVEQGIAGKAAGAALTLPMQIPSSFLSPFDTSQQMVDSGESTLKAAHGAMIDAAGNAAGLVIGPWGGKVAKTLRGGAINMAQDAAVKTAIVAISDKEETKKKFSPTWEDAAVAGIVGGAAVHLPTRNQKKLNKQNQDVLQKLKEAKATEQPKNVAPEPTQLDLFDFNADPSQGLHNQFNAGQGFDHWRVDENGMPIRADLSMELQNLQEPLQKNLWGDELGPALDQTRSLTEAIDATPKGVQRNIQMKQLGKNRGAIEADADLNVAKMEADGPKIPQHQRGAIDVQAIKSAGDDVVKLWKAYKGTFYNTEMQSAEKALDNPGARDTIVFLSPKEFHQLAQKRPSMWDVGLSKWQDVNSYAEAKRELIREGITSPDGLSDIPYLKGRVENGKMIVDAHNGRHRMDVFKENGIGKVPVRLRVWQDEGFPGWGSDNIPKSILGENGIELPMPENLTRKGSAPPQKLPELSLIPKGQRGAIDTEFLKGISSKGKEALETLYQSLYSRYASSGYKDDNLYQEIRQVQGKMFELEKRERISEGLKVQSPKEVFPGFTHIPSGTKIKATHGLKYKEPTMGTVVGTKDIRFEDGPYRLPVVDFGDGKPRSLLPGDIKEVFAPRPLPKSQRGALDFGTIPDNPDPTDIVKQALTEGKDGSRLMKNLESGSSLAAARRGSAAVRGGGMILQNADKRADLNIRRHVFPTEQSLRRFNDEDFKLGWEVLKMEMLQRSRFTGEQLESAGIREHQLEAYVNLRKMHEEALDAINDARLTQGLDPVTPQEYYVSSRWSGDFRRPVYDQKGKLAWYLAANTKAGLNKQTKALLKTYPDLVVDTTKDHHVRSPGINEIKLDYTTMLDIVGRNSEAGEKIQRWYEAQEIETGQKAYAQEKHFEQKGNTRGFVGDRPGANPIKEAKAAFAQQIQYAKNAFKWAEIQKAAEDLKKITNDPELVKQQPNNVQYLKDLFKNYAGMNEARFVRNLEDGMRDSLGISPRVANEGLGGVKSFFILQKLGVSAGYTLASALQYLTIFPHMVDMQMKGVTTKNPLAPLTSSILGALTGMSTALSHYGNKAGMDTVGMIKSLPDGDFLSKAYQYAEDNGITARSIYDESPIHTQGNAFARGGEVVGKTLTVPETFVRASAFMSYVYLLRQGNMFDGDPVGLFQKAEELTNISMVDYRSGERPLMFSKLGMAGNLMNTLQTFPMNFYNQYLYFGKEAMKGNPVPLLAAMSIQMGVAGMMGVPGFQDLDWLWSKIKPMLSDKQFAKVKDFDPKLFVLETMGDAGLYGKFAEATDLGITSRVSAPAITEMPLSPFGMIGDLAEQVGNVGSFMADPTNQTKQAQAGMSVAPVGLQGLLETTVFKDQTSTQVGDNRAYFKSSDLSDRSAAYVRTPEQEKVRKILGLKTLDEMKTREIDYRLKKNERDIMDRSRSITEKYYDAVRSGNKERAESLAQLYVELNGKPIDKTQIERQIKEEFLTEAQRKVLKGKNMSPQELINLRRSKNILEDK